MNKLDLTQGSQEWLEARKKYRSASEAAVVLGISPFQTPENLKLIQEGLATQYVSPAMRRGHELEDLARGLCNERFQLTFEPECWAKDGYLASLDGRDGEVLVEIKASAHTYRDLAAGVIPSYYLAQIQVQLHCSPASIGYLVAIHPLDKTILISEPITYDALFMEDIGRAFERFEAMPIPEVPFDASQDNEIVHLFEELRAIRDKITALKAQEEALKANLIGKSGPHGLKCRGHKLTPKAGPKRVDYKRLVADHDLDLGDYTKQGEPTWQITLAKGPFDEV